MEIQTAKISERDITRSIRDYLAIRKVFHWKVFQTLGSTPGIADILGILPSQCECGRKYGRMLVIEVKTATNDLSIHQKALSFTMPRNLALWPSWRAE